MQKPTDSIPAGIPPLPSFLTGETQFQLDHHAPSVPQLTTQVDFPTASRGWYLSALQWSTRKLGQITFLGVHLMPRRSCRLPGSVEGMQAVLTLSLELLLAFLSFPSVCTTSTEFEHHQTQPSGIGDNSESHQLNKCVPWSMLALASGERASFLSPERRGVRKCPITQGSAGAHIKLPEGVNI